MYLSKQLGGIIYHTSNFCVQFIVPYERYNGQIISARQASDCAAWAANAAAAVVGLAYAESNGTMSDQAMELLFRTTWGAKMSLTSCGYGSAAQCNPTDCLSQSEADWNNGFFDWLDEQFFGCQ